MEILLVFLAACILARSTLSHVQHLKNPSCPIRFSLRKQLPSLLEWIGASSFLALGVQLLADFSWWALAPLFVGCLIFTFLFVNIVSRLTTNRP